MLICPQCQAENPSRNKFCQRCGNSLTSQPCYNCGTPLSFSEQTCLNCGTETLNIWWAVLQQSTPRQPDPANLPTDYLDESHRYRLLSSLVAGKPLQSTRVLDCSPLEPSPLDVMDDSSGSVELLTIPPIAEPYLILPTQINSQVLPRLHDAWDKDGRTVVLLEDRSRWPQLVELWRNSQVSTLQLLHWFHEIIDLWDALEPWGCRQSLLELSNLRVDEDQVLCLQQLYPESTSPSLRLSRLCEVWQALFEESDRTQIGAMASFVQKLRQGSFSTVEELNTQVKQLAQELQQQDPALELGEQEAETLELETSSMTAELLEEFDEEPPSSDWAVHPDATRSDQNPTDQPEVTERLMPPLPMAAKDERETDLDQPEPVDLGMDSPGADQDLGDEGEDDEPTAVAAPMQMEEEEEEEEGSATVVLPLRLVHLSDAGRTDVGNQRRHNEDYYTIATDIQILENPLGRIVSARGVYILCDGMGGHEGGEVASSLVAETLRKYFQKHWLGDDGLDMPKTLPSAVMIQEGIHQANQVVYSINQQNARSGSGRMGTTLVLVLIQDTQIAVAHVGDSRLYRLGRTTELEKVTIDHEVGQQEITRGVDPDIAYAQPDAYQLTQAIGPRDNNFVYPGIQFFELNEDTLLLLCSDGLSDNDLVESHWKTHLKPLLSKRANLEEGAHQLIELANRYNGHDNITAILIRIKLQPNVRITKE